MTPSTKHLLVDGAFTNAILFNAVEIKHNECLKLLYGEKQPQMAAFPKSLFITKHDDDEHRRRGPLRSQS